MNGKAILLPVSLLALFVLPACTTEPEPTSDAELRAIVQDLQDEYVDSCLPSDDEAPQVCTDLIDEIEAHVSSDPAAFQTGFRATCYYWCGNVEKSCSGDSCSATDNQGCTASETVEYGDGSTSVYTSNHTCASDPKQLPYG